MLFSCKLKVKRNTRNNYNQNIYIVTIKSACFICIFFLSLFLSLLYLPDYLDTVDQCACDFLMHDHLDVPGKPPVEIVYVSTPGKGSPKAQRKEIGMHDFLLLFMSCISCIIYLMCVNCVK